MHRTIEITVASSGTDQLIAKLQAIEHVVGISLHRGASVQPPGDVVTVHSLNRGSDEVMRAVTEARLHGPVSVATAELASLSDAEHQPAIDDDVDEALWEELETGLRHQGRITPNFLILMGLGGAIAGAGLLATGEPALQIIAAVAAAVVAPGFEPIAKIPLGIVLKRREVLKSGLVSSLAGYGILIAAAAATYGLLAAMGAGMDAAKFGTIDAVKHIAHPSWPDLLISAFGALAGVTIQSAFRQSIIAGALIAMRMIDAAAVIGVGTVLGRMDLAAQGLQRLGIDLVLIVLAGLFVFGLKQAFVHKRAPMH